MRYPRVLRAAAIITFTVGTLGATGITYTCDASIDAAQPGTCNWLKTVVAGYYNQTFSNANASIYIQMGSSGLGSSTSGFLNLISYSTFRTDLAATASTDAIDSLALSNLPAMEPATFAGGSVEVTSALGAALGIPSNQLLGTTSGGVSCSPIPTNSSCYNGIITIGSGNTFYWDQNGGQQPSNSYDFYSVVQHETDEILGTISCVTTSGSLGDGCAGLNNVAVADLFRYSSSGTRVFKSTTPSTQYFSYDGGATDALGTGVYFNTLANGNDYADIKSDTPQTKCKHVQDAIGCVGGNLTILNDGGAEIRMLDAVGYNVLTPEPGTVGLFIVGMSLIGYYRRRRAG